MSREMKQIKDILLNEVYKYESELEQKIPLDQDGEIRHEYLSYVSLHTMHNLIEAISKDVAHVIIEKKADDTESVNAYVNSSFYVIPVDMMDTLVTLIKLETENLDYPDEHPDIDDDTFNA